MTLLTDVSDEQSVAEFCGYLAHYPGSEPDQQRRRFDQQHAQCVGDHGPIYRSMWATATRGFTNNI